MHPLLLEIGTYRLHTFGVLVALGFLAGLGWSAYEAKRRGFDRLRILDLCFWLLIWGIVGARLLFITVNWDEYSTLLVNAVHDRGVFWGSFIWLIEAASVWKGGIVWFGGLILAFAMGLIYTRKHGLPKWETADLVAPGVMLGLAVGRLGCLAAGDDYGKLVESAWDTVQAGGEAPWWTLTFTNNRSLVPDELLGKPLYPVQVMMSLTGLVMFAVLVALRKIQRFPGQVVWVMVLGYSLLRFFVEFFRGDVERGVYFDGVLSTSQMIAIGAVPVSLYMLKRLANKQNSVQGVGDDGSKNFAENTGKGTSA